MNNTIENKKFRLEESKIFCMAPWISLSNQPNGNIKPCCIYIDRTKFGNLYQNDINEIWNGEEYKNFRKRLLNDEKSPGCERCYKYEEWGDQNSLRKLSNSTYQDKYDELVLKTTDDGYIDDMQLIYWDFRFSNLCNLACIGCSPECSSKWVEQQNKVWPNSDPYKIFTSSKNKEKFISQIKLHGNNVRHIYFAGGEPLIQPEHYEILEELKLLGRLNAVSFTYSSNLTNLIYKKISVIDYWTDIKKIKVLVSLDEIDYNRLYYMRNPSNLNDIIKNIKTINKILNTYDKRWAVNPVWSILNLHRIKDIMEFFYKNDLLPNAYYVDDYWENDFHNTIMMNPDYLYIENASIEWKKYLNKKLTEYQEWYKDILIPLKSLNVRDSSIKKLDIHIKKFKNALNGEGKSDTESFVGWINRLDNVQNTNFCKTFPELEWIYYG